MNVIREFASRGRPQHQLYDPNNLQGVFGQNQELYLPGSVNGLVVFEHFSTEAVTKMGRNMCCGRRRGNRRRSELCVFTTVM